MKATDPQITFYLRDTTKAELAVFMNGMKEKGWIFDKDYRITNLAGTIKIFRTDTIEPYHSAIEVILGMGVEFQG